MSILGSGILPVWMSHREVDSIFSRMYSVNDRGGDDVDPGDLQRISDAEADRVAPTEWLTVSLRLRI